MPTVPTYQRQTQDRMAPGNTSTLRLPQNNAMTALADVGAQALDVYQQKKNQQDLAQGQEALLTLNQYADDLYSHPQTGLLTKQGKNAIGQAQASIDLLQNKAEELYSALPDGPFKEKFFLQFQEVGLNNGRRFRGYEIGQTQDYEAGNFKGLLNNLQQQEIAAFDDPQTAEMVRRNRQQAIEQYGQVHGWSQEQIIAEMAGADHKTLLQQAQNYAVAHPERWLNGDFLSRQTGGMDMRAIAMVESNGRHVRPDGSLVTSDEGAQGKYQLMPETGRYLAEKRGVTYDPADEAQHALLARDYANALYEKYDSETLAGAAYNWGPGHVDKLIAKVGDPRKGDITEAEFINHLPQQTQGWLNRYRKNKTGLNPVALNRIDNLATAQIQQQREALRAQVDPVINNTLAQLYNGDVPDAMPDKRTIMAAYGDQGEKWVKQLDIAIDNAMKFQAIQYIPPAQQQEEIDQMKPQANDPDYALKLDAYGKLKSLVKKSNEIIKAQRDTRKFNDALVMGEKLDPNDKAMQSAASATSAAQNFRIHDGTTHDDIFIQVAQTGIIPAQVTSQLTAISRASSPDLVAQGADLFDRLHGADQAAIGDLTKEMRGFYMTVKQLKDAGMAVSDAVKEAQDATYRQSEMLKAQLASTQGTTEYRKVRTKAMESAVSSMSQWFRRDPAANDGTPEARDFRNDYQILYDIHYRASGGNAEVAKKMTNQEIARNWMISEVNGSAQFMKYAPEALYHYGPEGWQAAQWKEEKQRLMYGESEDTITTPVTQVGITSERAAFIQRKTPESRISGDLEIVADISTPKTGDYAVVIKDKDSAGIVRSQILTDKYGQPRRWKPSLADWPPYQKMEEERKQDDQKRVMQQQAHKGLRGWRREEAAVVVTNRHAYAKYKAHGGDLDFAAFREEVGNAMRNGDVHGHAVVQETAQAMRQVVNRIKVAQQEMGLLPADEELKAIGQTSYFPRLYKVGKIINERDKFREILVDWWSRGEKSLSREEAEISADATINKIIGARIPQDFVNVFTVKAAGSTKARTLNVPDRLMKDYLESDANYVLQRHIREAVPEVELTRTFGDNKLETRLKDIEDEYDALIRDRPEEQAILARARDNDRRDIIALRDRLMGTYKMPNDPTSFFVRAGAFMRNANFVTKLGGMTVSAIPDLARGVMVHGFSKAFRGYSAFLTRSPAFKSSRAEQKKMAVGLETILHTRARSMGDLVDSTTRKNAIEAGMERLTDVFGKLTLMGHFDDMNKAVNGMITSDTILSGAISARKLAKLGINNNLASRIQAEFKTHGEVIDGWHIGNFEKWDDQYVAGVFQSAVLKDVNNTNVTPGIGDTPLWASSPMGKTIFQFKSFIVGSYNRATLGGLQEGTAQFYYGTAFQIGLGAMTYVLKEAAKGNEIDWSPQKLAIEGLDRSGILGPLMEYNNMAEKTFGGAVGLGALLGTGTQSRYASRGFIGSVIGPTFGLLDSVRDVAEGVLNGEVGDRVIHNSRTLLPGNNLFWIAPLINQVEEELK